MTLTPDTVAGSLDERQYKLYKLIWERFVACQMTNAQWDTSTVLVEGPMEAEGTQNGAPSQEPPGPLSSHRTDPRL